MKPLAIVALALVLAAGPALASPKGLDTKLNVNFLETPLPDALNFVAVSTGVHVVVDPGTGGRERPVTVKLTDVTAKAVLTGITSGVGLAWDERWGGVFVSTKEGLKAVPKEALPLPAKGEEKPENAALRKRLATQKVTFTFDNSRIYECLEFVRVISNLNIIVDDAVRSEMEEMAFSGSVEKAAVGDALSLILVPRGLTAELIDGVVFVRKAGPKKVAPKPTEKKGVPKVLDETGITVNFVDTPLLTVLGYLSRKTGYPMHLDPYAEVRSGVDYLTVSVTVAEEVPVRTILDLVTTTKDLDWDIRWGGVFVATRKRLDALPKVTWPKEKDGETAEWEVALRRRLGKETVSFDFSDTGLDEVLTWIRDTEKLNILLEPGAAKSAAKTKVSLRVAKRPVGEVLTLLLAPLGFRFALEHEVVVVRRKR